MAGTMSRSSVNMGIYQCEEWRRRWLGIVGYGTQSRGLDRGLEKLGSETQRALVGRLSS